MTDRDRFILPVTQDELEIVSLAAKNILKFLQDKGRSIDCPGRHNVTESLEILRIYRHCGATVVTEER